MSGSNDSGARKIERRIAALFGVAAVTGIMLLGVYLLGGQTQIEGVLLAITLGGIGIGIIAWSQWLLPGTLKTEDRHPSATYANAEAEQEIIAEESMITRRSLLVRALGAALAGLAAALAIPVLSLGPAPGRSLFETPWKRGGLRLVGLDGQPIQAADLPLEGVVTAFPEGYVGSADAQTVLIRVAPELLQLPADRGTGRLCRVLEDVHPRGMPRGPVPRERAPAAVPVPPVHVQRARRCPGGVRARRPAAAAAAHPAPE